MNDWTDQELDALLARFDQTEPALQRRIVAKFAQDRVMLEKALGELVKLQAHYAKLLNQYDGGQRHAFDSAQEWLDRLAELKTIAVVKLSPS